MAEINKFGVITVPIGGYKQNQLPVIGYIGKQDRTVILKKYLAESHTNMQSKTYDSNSSNK